ncbi:ABC transporter substrate-binding protein [Bogoriella caseilytica]|uniref:ABC transporter substrate-binding protein n=1 Tax=Bogoriella caseilytica TaxID=56055 RepID=UPI001FE795C5|nr:ABC transporter substrate-binding protein [Bogoriella caseilytica]
MTRTSLRLGTLAAAAALVLTACGESAEPPAETSPTEGNDDATTEELSPEIIIGSTNEPSTLERNRGGTSGVRQTMTRNVYESLGGIDVDGEIYPALAEDWSISEDGLTYTFDLREDVTFHDGTPFTSADVVWSLSEIIAEESGSARRGDLLVMEEITAVDEHTVEIQLSEPSRSLIFNIASETIVKDGDLELTADNGTGPYRFVEWVQGSFLTLERYDDYWGEPALNEGVTFEFFTDTTALNNALATGRLDLVIAQDSPDQLAQFEDNPDFVVTEGTSTTKQLWAFNNSIEPFGDTRVRQALYRAIDREAILDAVWAGRGQLIGSMVPPADPWYVDLAGVHAYDPDSARELLEEAGVENLSITVDYIAGDVTEIVAQQLQSDLAAIDVTLNLNPIDSAVWYERIYTNHDFETTIQSHVNPRDVLWYANPDFYWGYDSADFQELVARAEAASSDDEQVDLLRAANELLAEDAASAWLYLVPQIRVAAAGVSGFSENQATEAFYVAEIVKES